MNSVDKTKLSCFTLPTTQYHISKETCALYPFAPKGVQAVSKRSKDRTFNSFETDIYGTSQRTMN